MFERFNRSWELVKASWAVLRQDKELLIFPIVSFLGSIVVLITFAIPMIAAGVFDSMASRGSDDIGFFGLVVGFLFYLVMYTVVIFSNTALVGAAMIRLDGGNPTLADGFRIARERLGIIVAYAAISATVGMILRARRSDRADCFLDPRLCLECPHLPRHSGSGDGKSRSGRCH